MTEAIMVTPEEWRRDYADFLHEAVFEEKNRPELDRIAFALVLLQDSKPVAFATCQERNAETLYIQYAGVVKEKQGSGLGVRNFAALLGWAKGRYKRVIFNCLRTNTRMVRIAASVGFLVNGITILGGRVFVEHMMEFGGE